MNFCQEAVAIAEKSQVGQVRRLAGKLATSAGLDADDVGKAAIVATELATNMATYAPGGEILLRSFYDDEGNGVEILAIDRGPGMENVGRCLEDGYSTGGTPGNGLGAIQRLSSEFDIFSHPSSGTVVFSRIRSAQPVDSRPYHFASGAINRPAPGELLCGDTWRIALHEGRLSVMVADGLGHGPLAAEAADGVADVFALGEVAPLSSFFVRADARLRGTRGAAVAVANVNTQTGIMHYAGVGNIAGSLRSRGDTTGRGLVSHNGTVGVEMRKVQEFEYPCPADPLLIMHSDGLQSRWRLDSYPGLMNRHPAIVASILYRDFVRGKDDVTVCVIRSTTAPDK